MLSARNRFHGHGSLRYLFKNGDAVRSRYCTIKYIRNPRRTASRFAVVVSKKVHKSAVGRNRIRRRIYEIMRERLPDIPKAYDISVIVTSGEMLGLEAPELRQQLIGMLERAQLFDKLSSSGTIE